MRDAYISRQCNKLNCYVELEFQDDGNRQF